MAEPRWRTVVLGRAQDGGRPHAGCDRPCCVDGDGHPRPAEPVSCLGITDGRRGWLLDATPDLPAQCRALGVSVPDGIFLTHAHLGHYLGLAFLGKEVLGARGVPVHGTGSMARFLRENLPWRNLVEEGRIDLRPVDPVDLGGVTVTSLPVPHRGEISDTVAFLVAGPRRRVLYLPDIDRWDPWETDIRVLVESVDVAYLDATFLDGEELGRRSMAEVPHPPVRESMERLRGLGDRVRFLHMNHTNPLLLDPSVAEDAGFGVARVGDEVEL